MSTDTLVLTDSAERAAALPPEALPPRCPNCDTDRHGAFCHTCGQHYLDGRLTIRRIWREFAERFLKLERGLLATFRQLCVRPGAVALDYVDGRRKRYVNPLSYLFLGAAATLLILPLTMQIRGEDNAFGYSSADMEHFMEAGLMMRGKSLESMTPEKQAQFREVMDGVMPLYLDSLAETFQRLNSILAFAYALLLAGLLKLFMGGRGRTFTFAETIVLALFVTGHYYLLTPLLTVTVLPAFGVWAYTGIAFALFALIVVAAVGGFYDRKPGTLALGFLSFVVSYVGYTGLIMITTAPLAMYLVRDEVRAVIDAVKAGAGG